MAKQLNVDMTVKADTTQAKRAFTDLQKSLNNLTVGGAGNQGFSKQLQEGVKAATQLKTILASSTTSLGTLDLSKFTNSLQKSGMSLKEYQQKLSLLGTSGQQAFAKLAMSISTAELPLRRTSNLVTQLGVTLKNTAKWQLSSSMLHGFMSAISSAYGYAKDLNESLNNIRIRTGQSTEEMARFAEQANKSAQALSTTTNAYTKAALIYYQQGLDDEQVKARTDITVKMANVTKDSAETVSQQLTAVWNNFDKGGERLEYIADVMNALGAATASSTSEIATGLQKFAAAAEAAGLSYEYAASALATITATTRQSADTVGTGLRTVLARLESLKLGETLEDGVGLTKYTKALESIGVQVLDNNGQLKEANDILDAMAEKWSTLTNTQKMATAETVGGIRQYTTIMALMENWDFMQKNLDVAYGSSGTLQKQADIYAESWEAARKRVKAAAEDIYNALIDDKFFIDVDNAITKLLRTIKTLIDGFGGIQGVITTLGTVALTVFNNQIAGSIDRVFENIKLRSNSFRQTVINEKREGIEAMAAPVDSSTTSGQISNAVMKEYAGVQANIFEKQLEIKRDLTQEEQTQLQVLQEINAQTRDNVIEAGKELEKREKGLDQIIEKEKERLSLEREYLEENQKNVDKNNKSFYDESSFEEISSLRTITGDLMEEHTEEELNSYYDTIASKIGEIKRQWIDLNDQLDSSSKMSFQDFLNKNYGDEAGSAIGKIEQIITKESVDREKLYEALIKYEAVTAKTFENKAEDLKSFEQDLDSLRQAAQQLGNTDTLSKMFDQVGEEAKDSEAELREFKTQLESLINIATKGGEISLDEAFGTSGANAIRNFLESGDINAFKTQIQDLKTESQNFENEVFSSLSVLGPERLAAVKDFYEKLKEEIGEVNAQMLLFGRSSGALGEGLDRIKDKTGTLGQSITAVARMVSSLGMAFNSIKGLANVWNDEDTSTIQKIISTLTVLSSVTTSLTFAFNAENIAKIASMKTTTKKAVTDLMAASAKKAETLATGQGAAAGLAKIIVDKLQIKTTDSLIIATLKYIAVQAVAHWYLIAVAAAIAALVAIIAIQIKKYNEVAEAEKQAAETAQSLTDAYNDTKQAFEELIKTIEEYNGAKTALEELTEGTKEWKEKIQEANEKANELLNTYEQLRQYAYFNASTGLIEFRNSNGSAYDLEDFLAEQEKNLSSAFQSKVVADTAHLQAENALTTEKYIRNYNYDTQGNNNIAAYGEGLVKDVLSQLSKNFSENGGNLEKALGALSSNSQYLINQLGYTDQSLYELCVALDNNSNLMEANTQMIASSEAQKAGIEFEKDTQDQLFSAIYGKQLEKQIEIEKANIEASGGITQDTREAFAKEWNYTYNSKDKKFYDSNNQEVQNINDNYLTSWQATKNAIDVVNPQEYIGVVRQYDAALDGILGKTSLVTAEQKKAKQAIIDYLTEGRDNFDDLDASITQALKTEEVKEGIRDLLTQNDSEFPKLLGIEAGENYSDGIIESITRADPYAALDKAVGGYNKVSNIDGFLVDEEVSNKGGFSKSSLHNWFDTLSEEDRQLAVQIDFDSEKAKTNLEEALGDVRALAASEKVVAQLGIEEEDVEAVQAISDAYEEINRGLSEKTIGLADGSIVDMLEPTVEATKDATVRNIQLNSSIEDLYDNFSKYEKALDKAKKAENEVEKGALLLDKDYRNLRKTLAGLIGTTEDQISADMVAAVSLEDLEAAAMGHEDAIKRIRDAYIDAQAALYGITDEGLIEDFKNQMDTLSEGAVLDINEMPFIESLINAMIAANASEQDIQNALSGFHIDCDNVEFITSMEEMQQISGETAQVVEANTNRIIDSGSINAEDTSLTVQDNDQQGDIAFDEQIDATVHTFPAQVLEDANSQATRTDLFIPEIHKRVNPVPITDTAKNEKTIHGVRLYNPHKSSGGGVSSSNKSTTSPRSGGRGGGGGGGGGAKANPAKTSTVKAKKIERYKEITDEINDVKRAIDKTNTVSERLWGKNRLKSMKDANDLLKQQAENYKKKRLEAEAYYKIDQKNLQDALTKSFIGEYEKDGAITHVWTSIAQQLGSNIKFEFDEDGSITNFTEVYTKIVDKYNKLQEYANTGSNFSNADEQAKWKALNFDPFAAAYEYLEEQRKQFEETTELIKDLQEAEAEKIREIQDNNFEQLEYTLELKIEVDERELKKLEYYIEKMQDDFYLRAENLVNYIGKVETAENTLKNYADAVAELNKKYEAGEISEEAYFEKLKEIQDEEYEELQNLKDLDKEISQYYGETIEAANEELGKYTDRLEHINSVLEHYKEIMTLLGKQTNYKMMNDILEGVANNTLNSYIASKTWFEELSDERARLEKQLAGLEVGSHEYNTVKQELQDVVEAHEEAEDDMYEKAEATAEAFEAVWQNTVESVQHDFEMLATNGLGFDFLNDSLDRLSSRQDEYLTKTNQIYEMNDLLRKLQADADKTSNAAAKQRIANFSREMEQLKNKNELSKLDLDIAKARYQQVLAEIALEEAQNAKSMVRLRRDSEGNYGYMYTTDQDQIGKAEDDLAKANNDLYNIALNATNDYAQKQIKLEQDFKDKVAELSEKAAKDEIYRTTQYYDDLAQLQQEFENLSKAYTTEYNTAVYWLNETAATDQTEAWTSSYDTIMEKAADWSEFTSKYVQEASEAMEKYVNNLQPLMSGPHSLEISEESIGKLAKTSKELTDYIIGDDGLIHALGTELTSTLDVVDGYLDKHQKMLWNTISAYEALALKIGDILKLGALVSGEPLSTDEQLVIDSADKALESFNLYYQKASNNAASMASGGYTGSWGGTGKLAMLHEKELVLNSTDTENLLMSVDILRRLTTALDLQAMSSGLAALSATSSVGSGGNTLAQDVTIHAEFPNAVDHNEIEMAFDSLINRASQYAGRF